MGQCGCNAYVLPSRQERTHERNGVMNLKGVRKDNDFGALGAAPSMPAGSY